MAELSKRKAGPHDGASGAKRKKAGNYGKWTTPHQTKVKSLNVERGSIEPGDVGVWVTCARGMEGKAAHEMTALFDKGKADTPLHYRQYIKEMYDISPPEEAFEQGNRNKATADNGEEEKDSGAGEEDDIEALIRKEIASLKAPHAKSRYFTRVRPNVECLLFARTRPPIDPVAMARRISVDARQQAQDAAEATQAAIEDGSSPPIVRTSRYLNRLTPIAASGRATEKGIREVARQVLSPWFTLVPEPAAPGTAKGDREGAGQAEGQETGAGGDNDVAHTPSLEEKDDAVSKTPSPSFAIRISHRHHNELGRRDVIDLVAGLIDQGCHKVNLENPDKVVLVDIFKYTCGMSVVDGDWNDLRKYNLSELYNLQYKSKTQDQGGAAAAATATKNENTAAATTAAVTSTVTVATEAEKVA